MCYEQSNPHTHINSITENQQTDASGNALGYGLTVQAATKMIKLCPRGAKTSTNVSRPWTWD